MRVFLPLFLDLVPVAYVWLGLASASFVWSISAVALALIPRHT